MSDWSTVFLNDIVHYVRYAGGYLAAKYDTDPNIYKSYIIAEALAYGAQELAIIFLQINRLHQLYILYDFTKKVTKKVSDSSKTVKCFYF